jgi:hypothetical protein
MKIFRLATRALLLLAILPHAASAQGILWSKQSMAGPPSRIEVTTVYDSVTQRMIAFGGYDLNWYRMQDLWEFDLNSRTWTEVTPVSGPLPVRRSGQSMAFDPVRRVVVMFGGYNDDLGHINDTWEWDTVTKIWTNVTPATSPSRRRGARLVYDSTNARMILVGGVDENHFSSDTWQWNPAARVWTRLTTTTSSPSGRTYRARAYSGAAFNPTAGRGVTVFAGVADGGGGAALYLNDVWELRGTVWTDVTPAGASPAARAWTQLAWDSDLNRMVMFAGYPLPSADTWQLANDTWTQITNANPSPRDSHGMFYDTARHRVVVFGGYLSDVIELTGNTWELARRTDWPPPQDRHVAAYDTHRERLYLYGANVETWEYVPATSEWGWYYTVGPGGRVGAAVVYDQARRKMLMVGGRTSASGQVGTTLADTWEQDTATKQWTQLPSAVTPAREDHAMVYDAAHNRTILFGGRDGAGQPLGDTWLWNSGAGWINVTATAQGPSARYGHAMAYDPVRGVVILVGGRTSSTSLNDVWEWDGAQERWRQANPTGPVPSPRAFAALSAFDSATGGVLLFGGTTDGTALLNDSWIWNGSQWTQALASAPAPAPRQMTALVYSPSSRRLMLYGGRDGRGRSPDLFFATVGGAPPAPAPLDMNNDGFADLIWRNSTTGANVVWYLNGTSLVAQAHLPTEPDPAWQSVGTADINQDGHLDLLWRNRVTGDNVVWYLNGVGLLSQASLPTVSDLAWQLVASADINRDGHPDLIWRHASTGANAVWYLNGTTVVGQETFPSVTDLNWQLVATADVNQDGRADLVWRNGRTGANAVWYLDGTTIVGQANLPAVADLTWQLLGAADINRDGAPDLVWRNTLTGANVVWYLKGVTLQAQASLPSLTDPGWHVLGATPPPVAVDVNGDRHPDLIWRNATTGANVVWYLNGVGLLGQASLPSLPDLSWQIVAKADVDGDTHPDLIWRNVTTGDNFLWYLNGTAIVAQSRLQSVPDLAWKIVAAADLNGDTVADLVWRNTTTGANVVWYLNGGAVTSQASLPSIPDLGWQIVAVADFNGDTHPDLVWRNTATGANVVWYLNGTALLGQASLTSAPDLAWQIAGAADIDGDTHPDLIWRNTTTGANVVWYLSGTALVSQAALPTVSDTTWTLRP